MRLRIEVVRGANGKLCGQLFREGRPDGKLRVLGRDEVRALLRLTDRLDTVTAKRFRARLHQVEALFEDAGEITSRDLAEFAEIPMRRANGYLVACVKRGRLHRARRGVFVLPQAVQEAAE